MFPALRFWEWRYTRKVLFKWFLSVSDISWEVKGVGSEKV